MSPNVSQATTAAAAARDTITFQGGLLGFPDFVEYSLAEGPGAGLFWLISEDGGPNFLVSDPFTYIDGYSLDLSPEQAARIEADALGEVAVLAISVPHKEEPWTANLQGPIVINAARRVGAQLVLPGNDRGVRVPFVPALASVLQSA